ncbi:ATP-dependent Clp protease ATP-binding subunit ClpX [Pseudoalteromonas marina]|uniref:ATP-dependent Clp protease ATP-binding subunit ClpX n=1 Tax=Pseudoalteromonas marina TaxID=267375 RepID=A0ABT9FGW2_9GAMM|nr:ATP-dependent Clp protease ATP-binding subunit ClpX [Pseudoalteromonas marina]MDP2565865.1 ATP-dependent Clp protease ATP-binding subunit ClpX [Pseudoalteromonas marina]
MNHQCTLCKRNKNDTEHLFELEDEAICDICLIDINIECENAQYNRTELKHLLSTSTHCSGCGDSIIDDSQRLLLNIGKTAVCTGCLINTEALLEEELKEEAEPFESQNSVSKFKNKKLEELLTPRQIHKELDKHIIGQVSAKKAVAVAAYNHSLRINNLLEDTDVEVKKSNMLVFGPTGSGKTHIFETLSKLLEVPIVITDATSKTAAGYVGEDITSILNELVAKADGDIQLAEKGIIVIDESDKLSKKSDNPSITRDVSGEDVQTGLLKMMEGHTYEVTGELRKHPNSKGSKLDTKNVLFVLAGSFHGIESMVMANREGGNKIGFGADIKCEEDTFKYSSLKSSDFIKFGMVPELIGRVPVLVPLEELSIEQLRQVLTDPQNAITKQYEAILKSMGIKTDFSSDFLTSVAKNAKKLKLGARGLRGVIEGELSNVMYFGPELPSKTITIGSDKLSKEIKELQSNDI